jgi:DNA-binding LacI/PurR family transcriptional regulator
VKSRTGRKANQIAIARAAGVSVSTVSRALSNAPGISEERRTQIRKLASEAGYQGRSAGRTTTRTLLAYVTVSMATGGLQPFYDAIVRSVSAGAAEAGFALAVRLIDEATLDLGRLARDMATVAPAGTLLIGIDPPEEIAQHALGEGGPLLLVNGYDPEMRFDSVAPNNFYGGMLATRQLLAAGHRTLLYIEDHIRWTTVQRRRGFLAAIEEAPGASGRVLGIREDREGLIAAEIARRKRGESDWTAAFCVNDNSAIRLIGALEAAGLGVPGDISVIGFDDLPYAAMMSPPLTSLVVDTESIGAQAIALLLRRLAGTNATPLQVDCGLRVGAGRTIAPLAQVRASS